MMFLFYILCVRLDSIQEGDSKSIVFLVFQSCPLLYIFLRLFQVCEHRLLQLLHLLVHPMFGLLCLVEKDCLDPVIKAESLAKLSETLLQESIQKKGN